MIFFLSIIILWPFYFDILWKTSFENAWIPVTFAYVYPQAMLVELLKRRNKLLQLAAGFVFLCFWLTAPVFNVCQFGRLQLTWQKRFACYKSFAPLATKTNVIFLFQLFLQLSFCAEPAVAWKTKMLSGYSLLKDKP